MYVCMYSHSFSPFNQEFIHFWTKPLDASGHIKPGLERSTVPILSTQWSGKTIMAIFKNQPCSKDMYAYIYIYIYRHTHTQMEHGCIHVYKIL